MRTVVAFSFGNLFQFFQSSIACRCRGQKGVNAPGVQPLNIYGPIKILVLQMFI